MKRSTLFLVLAVLVIASLVLAACPSATPAPTEPPAAPAEQPTTPPEPTATPVPPTATPEPAPTEAPAEEPTVAPTEAPAEPAAAAGEPVALTCEEPIKVGLITDLTGGLAIYGVMTERSFQLGMEYASGAPGTEVDANTTSYQFGDCEVQVLVRDDKGSAEETATLARELIEADQVDLLVGTVSSGSTATLQEIERKARCR
jgi:branched-chain amino acid transport system substrate-binding protein